MRLAHVGWVIHNHDAVLIAAFIGAVGAVVSAWMANMARRSRKHHLDTGNGHTIGRGVAHIEELLHDVEDQLDRVEIQLREAKWEREEVEDV